MGAPEASPRGQKEDEEKKEEKKGPTWRVVGGMWRKEEEEEGSQFRTKNGRKNLESFFEIFFCFSFVLFLFFFYFFSGEGICVGLFSIILGNKTKVFPFFFSHFGKVLKDRGETY